MKSVSLGVLTLAGLASAGLEHWQVARAVSDLPVTSFLERRDLLARGEEPCAVLAAAYEKAASPSSEAVIIDMPPSAGIACLKSVPVRKDKDLELMDYLFPFVSFQTTLNVLADPPEGYLIPGVDFWGGWNTVRDKLTNDQYSSQYEFMYEFRSLWTTAADVHFDYAPALLNTLYWLRKPLDFVSLSKNGVALPKIFMADDVNRGNAGSLDYRPSAVDTIDGLPVAEWLENDSPYNAANYQDPDAQYNALFNSIPIKAAGRSATTTVSVFEIPDNHTISFFNGTKLFIENQIAVISPTNLTGIKNGLDFSNRFEIPPEPTVSATASATATAAASGTATASASATAGGNGTAQATASATASAPITPVSGYPYPVFQQSSNNLAGYLLNETSHRDTAVIALLDFLPINFDLSNLGTFDLAGWVWEAGELITKFITQARREGRDKLIIDLSANGGGAVDLAWQFYYLLFPNGTADVFNRMAGNGANEAWAAANYPLLYHESISNTEGKPLDPNNDIIESGAQWYGPNLVNGANFSMPFTDNRAKPWAGTKYYFNSWDPKNPPLIKEPPFKPENILIITDGTCASACNIFTGLMTRGQGVRTLALGGRPNNYAMQAMGGTKGSAMVLNSIWVTTRENIDKFTRKKAEYKILEEADSDGVLPSYDGSPLLPITSGQSGGQTNAEDAYLGEDLYGYPVHFQYEAAHCRLFYTQRMAHDPAEVWRMAANVAWKRAPCVPGSSTHEGNIMGTTAPAYNSQVKSRAKPIPGPGQLSS